MTRLILLAIALAGAAFGQQPIPGAGGASGGGAGGGSGNAGTAITTTFSATPTFTATSNTATTFLITLTGNVTSSTLTGASAGQIVTFRICQDGTGSWTFVPPTTVLGMGTISATASTCSNQDFRYDGSNANAIGAMVITGLAGSLINLSGSSSGTTGLAASASASGKFTLPAVTGTGMTLENPNTMGASGTADFKTNNALLNLAPQALVAVQNTSDAICGAINGTPACPAGGVIGGNTETGFTHVLALPAGVPGTNRAVRWTIGFDYAETAIAVLFKLKACATANYTPPTTCSSGGVTLFQSGNNVKSTTNSKATTGAYEFLFQSRAAQTLETTLINAIGVANSADTAVGATPLTETTSVPNTGAWTIYLTITWSAATAGDWAAITQSVAQYIN